MDLFCIIKAFKRSTLGSFNIRPKNDNMILKPFLQKMMQEGRFLNLIFEQKLLKIMYQGIFWEFSIHSNQSTDKMVTK